MWLEHLADTHLRKELGECLRRELDRRKQERTAGLKAGDVIQEINRKPVKTAEEAVKLTEHTNNKSTLLRVWRNGGSHYVVVDESKNG